MRPAIVASENCKNDSVAEEAEVGDNTGVNAQRPNRISVTFFRRSEASESLALNDCLGCSLYHDVEQNVICLGGSEHSFAETGVLAKLVFPTDRGKDPTFILRPGDVLESLNGEPYRNKRLDEVLEHFEQESGLLCFEFSTKPVSATMKESTTEIRMAIAIPPEPCCTDAPPWFQDGNEAEICFRQIRGEVQIAGVNSVWWENPSCVLQPGQVVTSIHDSSAITDANQAALLLAAAMETESYVAIVTRSTTNWRQKMRKASIAVSGGAMVGVGAVIMATPLHPIGHALAIGGVGVLGTEFQAPKKAASFANQKRRQWWTKAKRRGSPRKESLTKEEEETETEPSVRNV